MEIKDLALKLLRQLSGMPDNASPHMGKVLTDLRIIEAAFEDALKSRCGPNHHVCGCGLVRTEQSVHVSNKSPNGEKEGSDAT